MAKFLVFGAKTGWIGQMIAKMLKEKGYDVAVAETRLENIQEVSGSLILVAYRSARVPAAVLI